MKTYNYEWETVDAILKNSNTKIVFPHWSSSETTLYEVVKHYGNVTNFNEQIKQADKLWQKLKELFNKEIKLDDENRTLYISKDNEVIRSEWFDALEGEKYGDYKTLTLIIELLHHGQRLESDTILFAS